MTAIRSLFRSFRNPAKTRIDKGRSLQIAARFAVEEMESRTMMSVATPSGVSASPTPDKAGIVVSWNYDPAVISSTLTVCKMSGTSVGWSQEIDNVGHNSATVDTYEFPCSPGDYKVLITSTDGTDTSAEAMATTNFDWEGSTELPLAKSHDGPKDVISMAACSVCQAEFYSLERSDDNGTTWNEVTQWDPLSTYDQNRSFEEYNIVGTHTYRLLSWMHEGDPGYTLVGHVTTSINVTDTLSISAPLMQPVYDDENFQRGISTTRSYGLWASISPRIVLLANGTQLDSDIGYVVEIVADDTATANAWDIESAINEFVPTHQVGYAPGPVYDNWAMTLNGGIWSSHAMTQSSVPCPPATALPKSNIDMPQISTFRINVYYGTPSSTNTTVLATATFQADYEPLYPVYDNYQ